MISRRGIPRMSEWSADCVIEYYVDGVFADGSIVDEVLPNAIAGMEVYSGSATIPPRAVESPAIRGAG